MGDELDDLDDVTREVLRQYAADAGLAHEVIVERMRLGLAGDPMWRDFARDIGSATDHYRAYLLSGGSA